MNNNKTGALGALVLAGLLLRPLGSFTGQQAASTPPTAPVAAGQPSGLGREVQGDGPWVASCRYWAPARLSVEAREEEPSVSSAFSQSEEALDLHIATAGVAHNSACSADDPWGIPDSYTPGVVEKPDITAIIATVTDPVHTHMALGFDRSIDSIEQAAADNGYVTSYFWLPWSNSLGLVGRSESTDGMEPGHDPKRERQPGLIILKHVPTKEEDFNLSKGFYQVIYIFVVAETPTLGIDGTEFQNALRYELGLKDKGARLSADRSGNPFDLSIVGPLSSAAAAGLRQSITTAQAPLGLAKVQITGTTTTNYAGELLTYQTNPRIEFVSFGSKTAFEEARFVASATASGYAASQIFALVEDNTTFGKEAATDSKTGSNLDINIIKFPRGISLLRNAHVESEQAGSEAGQSGYIQSPYLRFSLRDLGMLDSVPDFSQLQTPLSQEAQLTTIARQLQRYRAQFVEIFASDTLDTYFLAQFVRRVCPDIRLVIVGGDLLFERETDNIPFVGTITISPYSLIGLAPSLAWDEKTKKFVALPRRAYPDATSEAYYNAVSYTLWNRKDSGRPTLAGYTNVLEPDDAGLHPPLWATTVGLDGYYPLAILNSCASDSQIILPTITGAGELKQCAPRGSRAGLPRIKLKIYPSLLWVALCIMIMLLSACHALILWCARYDSTLTCDLAIDDNDQPRRRSMYVNIGATMLLCMTFVVAFPLLPVSLYLIEPNFKYVTVGVLTILSGVAAFGCTLYKARHYLGMQRAGSGSSRSRRLFTRVYERLQANIHFAFNCVAWLTAPGLAILWVWSCCHANYQDSAEAHGTGLFFSYRCLNPGNGVSPVVPVLLLLGCWYLWAFFQTWRLRFSKHQRPMLPGPIDGMLDARLFVVSDNQVEVSGRAAEPNGRDPREGELFSNITCLLITRQVIRRFFGFASRGLDITLVAVYALTFILLALFSPVQSIDRFVWSWGCFAIPYEVLVISLFFPLLVVSIAGCLRMILVWAALRRSLLTTLEQQPIRQAFTRLKRTNLMTMFRQGGLREQWRDMARSTEAIRQMIHDEKLLRELKGGGIDRLRDEKADLDKNLAELLKPTATGSARKKYLVMHDIEKNYAEFSRILLSDLLIPHWKETRSGFVESDVAESIVNKGDGKTIEAGQFHEAIERYAAVEPAHIKIAEEFVAVRYLSLIRSVLVNIRYLMMFVATSFVVAMVAWNSYPFEPRVYIDWFFTVLLLALGVTIICLFMQIYRDPILSRIDSKEANTLGGEFYVRILSFGTIPVLTWLAYQFPNVGNAVAKVILPGLSVLK
jgi:hypothetical protein